MASPSALGRSQGAATQSASHEVGLQRSLGDSVRVWRPLDGWASSKKTKIGHYLSATVEGLPKEAFHLFCKYGQRGPKEDVPMDCVLSLPPVDYGSEQMPIQVRLPPAA